MSAGLQLDLAGADGAFDAAFDFHDLGFHFAGDVAGSANRDVGCGYVAIDGAVDLQRTLRGHRTVDLHVCADD